MIYKVTLLKDTPTLKAGVMWVYFTENGKPDFANQIDPKTFEVLYDEELMPDGILDNPEWAKVEPFYEKLDDLRGPICGETRGHLMVWPFSYTDSDGDRCLAASAKMEYACGHIRMLEKGR